MKTRQGVGIAGAVVTGTLLFGAAYASTQTAEPAADTNQIPIFKTATPVTVDGVLDEDCWKQATVVKADYVKGGNGKESPQPCMTAKYAWDDRYLYIAYDVFDANLAAKGNGIAKGPADNRREGCEISTPWDVAEFFVGFNNSNLFWEIHHNASNNFNDIMVLVDLPAWKKDAPAAVYSGIYWAKNEYVADVGDSKLASAVRMRPSAEGKPSTLNDKTDTDTGYTAELRLPWASIGGWSKMAGREITILAVTENGDSPNAPYHTSCATLPTADFFHLHFAKWPRYRLVAEGTAPAAK